MSVPEREVVPEMGLKYSPIPFEREAGGIHRVNSSEFTGQNGIGLW